MIEFQDVNYTIGDRLILSGVTFAVKRGETREILGTKTLREVTLK